MSSELPADPPYDAVALLTLELRRLLDVLGSLDEVDWERPTRCPGWTVLDIASHLLGDDLGYIAGHRDGHRGAPSPTFDDEAGFVTWLDALQADWVQANRRLSPPLVVSLLAWIGPQLVDTVAAEDPTERAATVSWASTDVVPRWLDHARELTERWIHRQQILDALDQPADLRPDLAVPVLDAVRWAFPFRLAAHARPPGSTVVVALDGAAEGEVIWTLTADADGWSFADPASAGGGGGPDAAWTAPGDAGDAATRAARATTGTSMDAMATMAMTEDQAWRLLSNNLDVAVHGRPVTEGDPELVATLLATRAIIGRPKPVA